MLEVVHVGSLLPAAVGACCAFGDRRRRSAVAWVPALVMLAAMLDVTVVRSLVHPLVWSLVLAGLSVWPALVHRRARAKGGSEMAVQRSLGLLVVAGLIVAMGHSSTADGHHSTVVWPALGLAAVIGFTGFSLWLAARLSRHTSGPMSLSALESASMGLSVALMATALSV
jgi:hypothetical protein